MGNCFETQSKSEEIADPLLDEPVNETVNFFSDSTTEEIDQAWGVRFNETPTVFGQDVTYTIEDLKDYLKELKASSLLLEELKNSLPPKKKAAYQVVREKLKSSILGLQQFVDHTEKFPPSILKRQRRSEDQPRPPTPPPTRNENGNNQLPKPQSTQPAPPYRPPPIESFSEHQPLVFSSDVSFQHEGAPHDNQKIELDTFEEDPRVREIREKRNLVKQLRRETKPSGSVEEHDNAIWGERTDQNMKLDESDMMTDHPRAFTDPPRPISDLVTYQSKREKDVRRAEKKAEKKLIKKELKKEKKGKKIQVLDDHIMRVQIEVLNPPRKGKYCLVLDLDYTLMDYTHYENPDQTIDLSRPYLQFFLTSCYQNYDIVIWSATQMNFIIRKLERLNMIDNPNYRITCALSKPEMIYTQVGKGRELVKALQVIWSKFPEYYNEDNTLHVDDITTNFYLNPKNGVPITAYRENTMNVEYDRELYFLAIYLNSVAQQPFLHNFDHTRWKEVVMCSMWLEVHRPELSPIPSLEFPFSLPLAEFISGNS